MINDKTWEHINELIGKGYIIMSESQYLFQMKYVEKHKQELEIMLGFNVTSVDEEKLTLYCEQDWTCDGDIFEKGSEILVAKNIKQPVNYDRICIEETHPFINTHPFSASLKLTGKILMAYFYQDKWCVSGEDRLFSPSGEFLRGKLETLGITHRMNPLYTYVFIENELSKFSIIGIINKKEEAHVSQDLFAYIVDTLELDRPKPFSFRNFDEAKEWVKEYQKILILRYDDEFMLELTPKSLMRVTNEN